MLQIVPDALQESSGWCAIDRPVIEGQAQRYHIPPLGSPRGAKQLLGDAPNPPIPMLMPRSRLATTLRAPAAVWSSDRLLLAASSVWWRQRSIVEFAGGS